MSRQADEKGSSALPRRTLQPRLWTVLLVAFGTLGACATNGNLNSDEPATVAAFEREYARRSTSASGFIGSTASQLLPSGAGVVTGGAWSALADSRETEYAEAVRISRVDGEAVSSTATEIEVSAGEHSLEVVYCRYQDKRSVCSDTVELNFRADPGESYQLRRNAKFHIELAPYDLDKKTIRSEAKAGIAQDEEACVRRRKNAIEYRRQIREIRRNEVAGLEAEAEAECRALVWGDGAAPD